MNVQFNSEKSIVINTVQRVAIVNGKEIPFHPKMKGKSVTTINGKSFIDGFELIDEEWKKTLKAAWHKYF
ncbi:hypothetical protein P4282_22930 [Bacillus swezeyi]|uniref:hypothetical protein n=1 Tax=Bacillus TaxID=1386 RepID=UPI00098A23F7|nr:MULTISPECIES: hypothetical protein [Bacillus]MED2945268.1 hypothetical protein [Bacillus swezeyi]